MARWRGGRHARRSNRRIRALLPKIVVVANAEIDALFPGVKRAIATLTTTDGRSFSATVDHAKGSPHNPMSDEEIIAKFRANAADVMSKSQQDAIIDATWDLEAISHMGDYMKLLVCDQ